MIRSFEGKTPRIAESAFVSEAAYIIGDVEIGENSRIWPDVTKGRGCEPPTLAQPTPSPKHRTPNTKQTQKGETQNPKLRRRVVWDFEFWVYLGSSVSNLGFPPKGPYIRSGAVIPIRLRVLARTALVADTSLRRAAVNA